MGYKNLDCDCCGEKVERFKDLKKVRKEYLCSECYIKNRLNHREETIERAGIKRELMDLKNKEARELRDLKYKVQRDYRLKKNGGVKKKAGRPKEKEDFEYVPPRYRNKKFQEENIPKIKGSTSKSDIIKRRSQSYLSFEEKKVLLSVLIKRGLTFNEAKERLKNLVKSQKEIRDELKAKGKSEEEIKTKQKELLEELI